VAQWSSTLVMIIKPQRCVEIHGNSFIGGKSNYIFFGFFSFTIFLVAVPCSKKQKPI